MSDICTFCNLRKPTNHLVLNGGEMWIEFCEDCGKEKTLTNSNNETLTVQQVYDSCQPQKPVKVVNLVEVAKAEVDNPKKTNHLREMKSRMVEDDMLVPLVLERVMLFIDKEYNSIISNRGLVEDDKPILGDNYSYVNNIVQFILK